MWLWRFLHPWKQQKRAGTTRDPSPAPRHWPVTSWIYSNRLARPLWPQLEILSLALLGGRIQNAFSLAYSAWSHQDSICEHLPGGLTLGPPSMWVPCSFAEGWKRCTAKHRIWFTLEARETPVASLGSPCLRNVEQPSGSVLRSQAGPESELETPDCSFKKVAVGGEEWSSVIFSRARGFSLSNPFLVCWDVFWGIWIWNGISLGGAI